MPSGSKAADLAGQKFNKLTVVKRSDKMRGKSFLWECLCDCGNIAFVTTDGLRRSHSKSCGCLVKEAGMAKRLTTEQWILKAKEVHGDIYDYSKVNYKDIMTKVEIVCNKHGSFWQIPNDHTSKAAGCKECRKVSLSKRLSLTTDEFIDRSSKVHNNEFSYENTNYVNSKTKVLVTCKVHGDFKAIPQNHLNGVGCPNCSETFVDVASNFNKFLENAKEKHGDKFNYSKVEYINTTTKVLIGCPVHGFYEQTPGSHLSSSNGCKQCGYDITSAKLSKGREGFIISCQLVHGNKYNYSKVKYKNRKQKVEIVCQEHGSFFPSAGNHLCGSGCPECVSGGFSTTQNGFLYIVKTGDFTKVGITNKEVNHRIKNLNNDSGYDFEIINTFFFENGLDCLNVETNLLRHLKSKYENPEVKFPGYSECFKYVDYENLIITINSLIGGIQRFTK